MSATINKSSRMPAGGWLGLATTFVAASLLLGLTACKTTNEAPMEENSGFLGNYSDLVPGTNDQAKLVYFNPSANWAKYTKVYIAPTQLWNSDDPESKLGKLDDEDKQLIINYAYTALWTNLSKDYQIVDQSATNAADVMVLRTAITEAKPSKPVLNFVGTVMPIGLALSYVKRGVFGTHLAVGSCQVEMELLDGPSGTRLAAAVDRRAGTKALRTKFDGSFGDVMLALDYWAERLQMRLAEERTGATSLTEL